MYNEDTFIQEGGTALKLLNRQIDMISWTSREGVVTPVRFRMEEKGKPIVIKVERILQTEKSSYCGAPMLSFLCSSVIRNIEKIYELTYNCKNQQWLLKKI